MLGEVIGGDYDAIEVMACSIAEAFYCIHAELEEKALSYLSDDLKGVYYAFENIKKPRTM